MATVWVFECCCPPHPALSPRRGDHMTRASSVVLNGERETNAGATSLSRGIGLGRGGPRGSTSRRSDENPKNVLTSEAFRPKREVDKKLRRTAKAATICCRR